MKVDVSYLEVGEYFTTARNETFVVTSRKDFPFIYTKCVSQPNEYDLEVCLAYEMVEVDKSAKFYKPTFVETSKNHFVQKMEKQW